MNDAENELMKKNRANIEAELAKKRLVIQIEAKEILEQLKGVGYSLESVFCLINTGDKYEKAIPILKKHLCNKNYSDTLKEQIYRALIVTWLEDDEIIECLFDLFNTEENDDLRWVIGYTLSTQIKKESHVKRIIKLLQDESYKGARSEFIIRIAKFYKNEAIPIIFPFLDDPYKAVFTEAVIQLGKLKVKEAIYKIENYTTHDDAWVRQKAKYALKRIG